MRRILTIMSALMAVLSASIAWSADTPMGDSGRLERARSATFAPLFQAMKQGDIETIKQYLRGDTYEQYRTLFEHNKKYGEFLRSYYAGATFRLHDISARADNTYVANISIEWGDGRKARFDLEVSPPKGGLDHKWMVGNPTQ